MKRIVLSCFLLLCLGARAQKVRTLVPPNPVPAGTAFQVQYVVTDPGDVVSVGTPTFDGLELVSGPNRYKGNVLVDGRLQPIINITYTLLAHRPGAQTVSGLAVQYHGGEEHSNGLRVSIVPPARASFHASSSYTDVNLYAPPAAADRERLIDQNLFVRATASRASCYVGEPVMLTFKLYSRLQSTSEVTNVPALYGFSMVDMLDANRSYPAVETINGQVFNTSVLRQLQLYGGQPGDFTIEGMDVQSEIEFDEPGGAGRKSTVNHSFSSPPLKLTVKPLPGAAPDDYTGAVGMFTLSASLEANEVTANTAARLFVTVRGAGNFIQFAPPAFVWPAGLSAFDSEVKDSLEVQAVPEAGRRTYVFRFTADSTGTYTVPPLSFSFFNPATNRYETVATQPLPLHVRPQKKPVFQLITGTRTRKWLLLTSAAVFIASILIWLLWKRRKRPPVKDLVTTPSDYQEELNQLKALDARAACIGLDQLLLRLHREGRIPASHLNEWKSLLEECQILAYAPMNDEKKKNEVLERAAELLK